MNDTTYIAWPGLDAHSKNCVLSQLNENGTEINWWRLPAQPRQLIAQVQAIAATDKRLMLEESDLARWPAQLLKPHLQQLIVCDAHHNRIKDVSSTQIYTHVMAKPGIGVRSPLD